MSANSSYTNLKIELNCKIIQFSEVKVGFAFGLESNYRTEG